MWRRSVQLLAATAVVFAFVGEADAETCVGVEMPSEKTIGGDTLSLNGMGLREATIFSVDVYVAGLYVEEKSNDGDKIASSDQKKHLALEFVRGVNKNKIVDAYRESFNKTSGGSKALKPKIEKLLGWMKAAEVGDTHSYTYIPDDGLTVSVDGSERGTIEGADFAEAFFKIWLGANPPNAGLKTGLLGGSCG